MTKREKTEAMMEILEYWFTVEFLSQDSFPKGNQKGNRQKTSDTKQKNHFIRENFILREQDMSGSLYDIIRNKAKCRGMKTWGNLTIYIGRVPRKDCVEYIKQFFPYDSEEEESPEPAKDKIACASLQLSSNGVYVEGSFSLSPILWAMSQLTNKDEPLSAAFKEDRYQKDRNALEQKHFSPENMNVGAESNLGEDDFVSDEMPEFAEGAVRLPEIQGLLRDIEQNYVKKHLDSDEQNLCFEECCYIDVQFFEDSKSRENNLDDNYLGLSHDFYSSDIKFILEQLREDSLHSTYMGEELENYILALVRDPERERTDLLKCPDVKGQDEYLATLLGILNVENAPLGKWPSRHMPALMQQVAINLSTNKTKEDIGRIFSVNGPPGTGKTTLLKEIVVNNIVERAILLSEYSNPKDAFEEHKFVGGTKDYSRYDKYIHHWYSLKNDKINDYGILVASCNNGAVENISKELPKVPAEMDPLDGDSETLKRALSEVADMFDANKSGAMEVRHYLNKSDPYSDIYFTKYAKDLLNKQDSNDSTGSDDSDIWGLISAALGKKSNRDHFYNKVVRPLDIDFDKSDNISDRLEKYQAARKQFREQLGKVKNLERQLQAVPDLLKKKMNCRGKLSQDRVQELDKDSPSVVLQRIQGETGGLRESISGKEREKEELLKRMEEETNSTRLLIRLFNRAKYDVAQKNIIRYKQKVEDVETQLVCLRQSLIDLGTEKNYIEVCVEYNDAVQNMMKDSEEEYTPLYGNFLECLFSDDNGTATKAQVSNPWFTEQYNREREKLFAYAMRLNKEFVLSTNACMNNLKTLFQYWRIGQNSDHENVNFQRQDVDAMMTSLVQTLFLVVPVISTTFASAGAMFKDVKESGIIGLLVVDEAGQAQPQMALGSLYRCRRAVVVGDPHQVEPVVTDDLQLLKKAFNNDVLRRYTDKTLSVQTFADRLNCFGTELDDGTGEPEWIGCPLLVHRRCIAPMFEISNMMSYANIMKQQTQPPKKEDERRFIYEKSQWINVIGEENGEQDGRKDHFVCAQGDKVCELLDIAFSKQPKPDIYIISPFNSVVTGVKKYLHDKWATSKNNKNYMLDEEHKRIGTVHTFQGREAEEVIFLLGCDESSRYAIKWVSKNIVNVAVTRAKYRLYIVGDAKAWENSYPVSMAKHILDTHALKKIKDISESDLTEGERSEALQEAMTDLPSLGSFTGETEKEGGDTEYSLDTTSLLVGLDKEFMRIELNTEQLRKFGLRSMDDFKRFSPEVQENLVLGIKLFFLLNPLFDLDHSLDASCCAILFCKSLELQTQECFYKLFQKALPEFRIRGEGKGRTNIPLKNANKHELTLGTISYVLGNPKNRESLAEFVMADKDSKYTSSWWDALGKRIASSAKQRNSCCHSGLFLWKDQSKLLYEMFREDNKCGADLEGLMFECRVGKELSGGK